MKIRGPVLPVQVSKDNHTNIIFAGALLSELVKDKAIKITNVKCGGSPFYYMDGQEAMLQRLSSFLPKKEQEAYEFIRDNKVVRDNVIEPWQRVALRSIRDYAFPLDVKVGEGVERFWKWYLLSNDEAEVLIRNILHIKEEIEEEKVEEQIEKPVDVKIEVSEQSKLKEIETKEIVKKVVKVEDNFYNSLKKYLSRSKIVVEKEDILKKSKEFNLIIAVPSSIGELRYYVKAKSKKTINDADLSLAYSEGQDFKLPILFLTNGKLTKKGRVYLDSKLKGRIIFKQI